MSTLQDTGYRIDSLQYQALFNLVPYPLVILKPDSPRFTIIDANDKYLEATYTQRKKIIGKSLFDLYRDNPSEPAGCNVPEVVEHFEQLLHTKVHELSRTFRWDIPIPGTEETEIRYWNMTITPVFNISDEVVQILSAPIDVTRTILSQEREKKAKKEIEFQKEYLHATFLQAPIGIGIYQGPDFIINLINPFMADFFERDYGELIGKPYFEVIDEAAGMGWENILHQVLYTGEPYVGFEQPVKLFRKGKLETFYLNFIAYPFYESSEKISGVIKVVIDATQQVLLKQKLQENEERLEVAVDSANLSVWEINLKAQEVLTIKKINLLGFPEVGEVWSIKRCLELVVPEDVHLAEEALAEAQKTGKFNTSVRMKLPDGSVRWIQATGNVHTDEGGDFTRIIGTTLDITARVELEQRKNDLIAIISHELKTPVTSIKAISQFLEQKFATSTDVLTYTMLKKIGTQINRLTGLIHDILDISRIEVGKLKLRKTDFLFNDLIEETVSEIQATTSSHEIIIEGEKLIPCHGDKDRLHQVLANLLTNAIKYSSGADKVIVSATSNTKEVTCCVTDFGIGIPEENLTSIFDRFSRVTEEGNYGIQGVGLGLYIAAEIIKRLDGKIWVTSKLKEGSTFCFSIPAT